MITEQQLKDLGFRYKEERFSHRDSHWWLMRNNGFDGDLWLVELEDSSFLVQIVDGPGDRGGYKYTDIGEVKNIEELKPIVEVFYRGSERFEDED